MGVSIVSGLMAKEVVAEATGALKIRAERFLHEIS